MKQRIVAGGLALLAFIYGLTTPSFLWVVVGMVGILAVGALIMTHGEGR
jgi:hypothetical protein